LPALTDLPVLTTPPSTVAPSSTVPSVPSTVAPSTSVPLPVPDGGVLPALTPGVSQVFVDGVPEVVEVFVADSTDLVLRGDGFQMALAGECSFGCTIRTDAEGRQVLELEENGLAKVEGEGFLAGTPVYVWLFSDPKFLGELTVNADGTFAGSVSLAGIEIGDHTLQVNGTSFDGKARTANLGVLVAPEGVPTPLPGVLPATGSDAGLLVWVMLLTAVGGALVWMSRRRTVPVQR
jgi:LPXTG-motif cell wall-anchored protein